MNLRRLLAISRRIADGFRRDRPTLGLLFVAPIVITALLGWVLQGAQTADTRVVVVDLDAGPAGGRLSDGLQDAAGQVASLSVAVSQDEAGAREDLREDRIDVAVIVPATFSEDLVAGTAKITVLTQGTNPGAEGTHVQVLQEAFTRAVDSLASSVGFHPPELEHETVYGSPDADELDVFGPVFIGYFAYFFVFILTGISFLRERVGGTLERLLATPVTRAEIVLGYSLGFGFFATLQVIVLIAFALMHVVFPAFDLPVVGGVGIAIGLDVASAGSPLVAFLIALVLALGAVNLGIFISTFARTELQIIQFIPIVIVPQGLLGGIFWPIETLPEILQPIARVMPVTYAVEGLRGVMIQGWGLDNPTLELDLVVLAAIAIFFVFVAMATIRREIA